MTSPGVGTLTELKTAYQAKSAEIKQGADSGAIKIEDGNVVVSQEDATRFKSTFSEMREIKSWIDMLEATANGARVDTTPAAESVAMKSAVKSFLNGQTKDLGAAFVNSEEFKELRSAGGYDMKRAYQAEVFDLPSLGYKDVYSAMDPGTITRTFGQIQFDPMVPRGQRRARVRDLFPVATTSANLIDYFQVIGFAENNAATGNNASVSGGSGNAGMVPDYVPAAGQNPAVFGLKPKSNLVFRSNQAPVRTIAHWEAAHRNALDDEPQLQSTINNELLYGLALIEDYQILKGSGANEDLLGIMNTPNIQTYTPGASELKSDTLRKAATLSILANYPASGYVLHPYDWESIELQKGTGDGQYMLFTNIAIGLQTQVWRQPVVETPVIDQGTFLTGAFGTGAQLYDRQLANVRISEHHADLFVRNAIAILCEERLALAVKRPESFIKGLFAGTASFPVDEDSNSAT